MWPIERSRQCPLFFWICSTWTCETGISSMAAGTSSSWMGRFPRIPFESEWEQLCPRESQWGMKVDLWIWEPPELFVLLWSPVFLELWFLLLHQLALACCEQHSSRSQWCRRCRCLDFLEGHVTSCIVSVRQSGTETDIRFEQRGIREWNSLIVSVHKFQFRNSWKRNLTS